MFGLGGRFVEVDVVAQRRARNRKFTHCYLAVWRRVVIRLRQRWPRKRGNQKQQRKSQGRDGPRERLEAHRSYGFIRNFRFSTWD
jgi:hypothetical protein